jgi:hypothetical protein
MTRYHSSKSAELRHRGGRSHLAAAVAALLLFVPLAALGLTGRGAGGDSQSPAPQAAPGATPAASEPRPSAAGEQGLPKVTIQGKRLLRRQVNQFLDSVITPPPTHESLLRWNRPICPLVVGLPRKWGEFILAGISQAARDARAPLAGSHCQPNLFVVVSPDPHRVLDDWLSHHPKINTPHGIEPLNEFLHSTRPVRVWYNSEAGCAGGVSQPGSAAARSSIGLPYPGMGNAVGAGNPSGAMGPTYCDDSIDTHLKFGDVRSIGYAIVVVDMTQLHPLHVTLGQLAGYVSLVGLADVQTDAAGGGVPTILRLFHDTDPPRGLTAWDRALLYSLYNTSQEGKLQLTDMEVSMVRKMAP